MDKCPRCGYEEIKKKIEDMCKCENLTVFDLIYCLTDGNDYCKKCKKQIDPKRVDFILSKGI